jgi:lipopolysaccharide transport system permease protein
VTEQHIPTADERPMAAGLSTTVIQPSQGWAPAKLKDLFQFRELLYFLIWRQLKVRYKQTVLGAAWAVIQPAAIMVVFSVFFGIVVRVPTEIPYWIFTLCGVVVWTYFSNAVNQASNSLVSQENLITKVYFPRLLIPIAAILAGLVDFFIAFSVLVTLIASRGHLSLVTLGAVPLLVVLVVVIALAVSLWLSALNVQYRDVRLLVGVMIQLWFFATPIIYPSNLVPESWRTLYQLLNPMVGIVEGFRWALLGQTAPPGEASPPDLLFVISMLLVVGVLVSGLYYFRRVEKVFADVV